MRSWISRLRWRGGMGECGEGARPAPLAPHWERSTHSIVGLVYRGPRLSLHRRQSNASSTRATSAYRGSNQVRPMCLDKTVASLPELNESAVTTNAHEVSTISLPLSHPKPDHN